MPISHAELEELANRGAFGSNSYPIPSDAQCKAGNYKMGRFSLHGIPIAIEQPRNTYRTGIDEKTGKRWTSRLAAHYGYLSGTKGADGDAVDCFVGVCPDVDYVYAVNQHINGRFDEHKILIAFYDQESAVNAYMGSYERGWNGLGSVVQLTIPQLKWWLKNGDKSRPINKNDIPHEGLEAMTQRVYWNTDAMPLNGRTLDNVLYEIRRSDSGEQLLTDPVTMQEIIDDSDGVLALDALVTPYAKLERKMEILQGIMERTGKGLKPVSMQISEPFKRNGVANVAVMYELSDGQTITIYLHNPDVTPQKMAPGDEVISWKWMLNKKDITIVVAPERGQDLNVREVARRIMKLAEKNSAGFARANVKRAERMQNIQSLEDEIVSLESELKKAENERDALKIEVEDRDRSLEGMHIAVREALSKRGWNGFEDGSAMTTGNYRVSGSSNDQFTVELLDKESSVWEDVGTVKTDLGKTAEQIVEEIENMSSGQVDPDVGDNLSDHLKVAALWKGATLKVAQMLEGNKKASLELSRMTTKGDLDAYLMRKLGIDDAAARDISNTLTAQDIPADMSADIEDYKDEPWYSLIPGESQEIDPTSPEDYAKIMADESLQLQYQDVLDSLFQGRIVATRNALRDLGWEGDQYAWPLTKEGRSLDVNIKHVGAGRNVSGVTWITAIGDITDDLTKTPEQLATDINASVPDVETNNEDPVIELTGKELGEFSEEESGKKALRSAAIQFYDNELIGNGVLNIALDRIVEFDKQGRNKIKSFSADPRKLHLVHALKSIVENGKPTPASPVSPHDKAARKGVKLVHILKTAVKLDGETVKVRFLVYEKDDGHLFYDHSVDNSEAVAVMGRSGGVMDSTGAADLNLSVLPPGEPSPEHHCIGDSIEDGSELINSVTLDSAGERMVFNLFIEGEEPEVIEDDSESTETIAAKDLLQSVVDGSKDSANLMDLLDEIDAASQALIDAGLDDYYDELIGKAAEKWAELDQKANG